MKQNIYNQMITRQKDIINETAQKKLKTKHLTVIGCGGLGGIIIEFLIRSGVENITIIDEDNYDYTNFNRQIGSNTTTINKIKAEITKNNALKINPEANIIAYNIKITEKNIIALIKNSEIVIDAVDNILTRVITSRACTQLKIPFIHSAIEKTSGQLTVFLPESPDYEELFRLKSANKKLNEETKNYLNKLSTEKPSVLGITPAIFGLLEVNEIIKYITDLGSNIIAPNILVWDLLDANSYNIITL